MRPLQSDEEGALLVVGIVERLARGAAAGTKPLIERLGDTRGHPLTAIGWWLAGPGKMLLAVAFVWPMVWIGSATVFAARCEGTGMALRG